MPLQYERARLRRSGSGIGTDVEFNEDAEVITGPYSVDRVVHNHLRRANLCMCIGVSVPGTDEEVVDPASMARLANDCFDLRAGIGIVGGPGVARSLAGDCPSVVVVHAAATERLVAGEVTDAARVGRRV